MDERAGVQEIKEALVSFSRIFNEYAKEILRKPQRHNRLNELRTQLQLQEPRIAEYIVNILGNSTVTVGSSGHTVTLSYKDLLATALLGGNNELPHNFRDYHTPVTSMINRAIGALDAGLWPPKELKPILTIRDDELRDRCFDLLSAPGHYDRVIREATTVLEDRIRSKCPHDILCNLIPHSADQAGENLINKLFAHDRPVLSISSEKHKQAAFHRILLGTFSYLRNPYHHRLDPNTEWSWAWSTVGFIDQLLTGIDSCIVTSTNP